jgi:citrate lyase subunit beta/citryl-CoA lyase
MEKLLKSLLFVPGDQAEKIEKAWQSDADCLILDLEDGVAPQHKAAARQIVQRALHTSRPKTLPILVRVNCDLAHQKADIEVAVDRQVSGIVLPKTNTPTEVVAVAREIERAEREKGIADNTTQLFLLIESARGLLELPSLAAADKRVAGLIFGAEDWCLDMGIVRTKAGAELEIARWNIALCARAHRLVAVDTVFADFRDAEGLLRDAEIGRRMGFSGKLAIHPKQIEVIHSAFVPTATEIADAKALVAAFDEAEIKGQGAIAFNGRMVDKPIAERARQVLLRAQQAKD